MSWCPLYIALDSTVVAKDQEAIENSKSASCLSTKMAHFDSIFLHHSIAIVVALILILILRAFYVILRTHNGSKSSIKRATSEKASLAVFLGSGTF